MNKLHPLGFAAIALYVIISAGCAREVAEDSKAAELRYLEAYNQVYYQGSLVPTPSGIYYISETNGYGTRYPADEQFVFVHYTVRSLSGTIEATDDILLSKQLGTYQDSIYFGPTLMSVAPYSQYLGWNEVMKGMNEGSHKKFIMPSWLSSYNEGGTKAYASPMIIDIEMVEIVPDMEKWQTDTLGHIRDKRFPALDSLAYDFYYKEIVAGTGDTSTVNDTLCISYVGYLLDGFVFDTNIADTAVKYGIYSSSKTYSPMEVVKNEMSFVGGFTKAIELMNDDCEAYTFFSFNYGYGPEKHGQIPPYSPLMFYIKLHIKRSDTEP